jgi:hypothetical protein
VVSPRPTSFISGLTEMRDRDLGEARGVRHFRHAPLMLREAVTVHENDGDRAIAVVVGLRELLRHIGFVERQDHFPAGADALRTSTPSNKHLRQHDVAVEDARPVLVGDAQRIAEAARDEERGALALALEQRVGRHRGAHLDRVDLCGGMGSPA